MSSRNGAKLILLGAAHVFYPGGMFGPTWREIIERWLLALVLAADSVAALVVYGWR